MQKSLFATVVLSVSMAVFAEDITLRSGRVLENADIIRVKGVQVAVAYAGGVTSIPTGEFPDEYRQEIIDAGGIILSEQKRNMNYRDMNASDRKDLLTYLTKEWRDTDEFGLIKIRDSQGVLSDQALRLGIVIIDSNVSTALGKGDYLIENGRIMIQWPERELLLVKDRLQGMAVENGIYQLPKELGGPKEIPSYKIINDRPVNEFALISALKKGQTLIVPMKRAIICPRCKGEAIEFFKESEPGGFSRCETCAGMGYIDTATADNNKNNKPRFGSVTSRNSYKKKLCPTCKGSGKTPRHRRLPRDCTLCKGAGIIYKDKLVRIKW